MMQGFLDWAFRNRETGAITIGQTPNLILWIVIAAAIVRLVLHPAGTPGVIVESIVTGGLIVWAADELLRGVNPWRRSLGAGVLLYESVRLGVWLWG